MQGHSAWLVPICRLSCLPAVSVSKLMIELLAGARSQLEAVQQQNGKLLKNLAAAQREAGDGSKQLRQAEADLKRLREQSMAAEGASQQAQHSMQAKHAHVVQQLRCADHHLSHTFDHQATGNSATVKQLRCFHMLQ